MTFAPLRHETGAPLEAVRAPAQSTFELVKRFEGFRPEAYRDAGGWSIGYGTFMGSSPSMQYVTEEQASNLLQQKVYGNVKEMLRLVRVPLSRNQFDALQSFMYNVGSGNFTKSTMLQKLNAGDYNGAAQEFMRWVYSGQTMLRALIQRRAAERDLFTTP
jgi:lysozyme